MTAVLRVALPRPLPHPYDYLPPAGDEAGGDWIGCRVRVPFGRSELVGVVTGVATATSDGRDLRAVLERLDLEPWASPELWRTLCWAAEYYCHPLGEVLAAALPATLRRGQAPPEVGTAWIALTDAGRKALRERPPRADSAGAQLLDVLGAGELPLASLRHGRAQAPARIRDWLARGWLAQRHRLDAGIVARIEVPALNAEQDAAVAAVAAGFGRYEASLLDGVTGSGKTEVYLELIRRTVARGEQALVLVPEIGLTPQTLRRFREQLPCPVLTLHSGLADGQRAEAWLAARSGAAAVLVGTRSAIFTPLARPGLIVVDEEHDGSYKQQDGFRYSARDLAVVRAHALGIPVLLGSATPSFESLHNVAQGRYRGLRLARRAHVAAIPPVLRVLDVRNRRLQDGLSEDLVEEIGRHLLQGAQVLVFRNRRGFSPVLMCHACGWHPRCVRCERPMTLHRAPSRLDCHHCGAKAPVPVRCTACGAADLVPFGTGTERLDAALAQRFPDVPVVRVDRDTTRGLTALRAVLEPLSRSEGAQLLVGTQMLAKGHDLARLTLVAIVGVDEALFSTDFRAAERLAQLIVQVSGRAGRADRVGHVWLQTHHPQHPLLVRLVQDGYGAFAQEELEIRRSLGFPPYTHMALLRAEAQLPAHAQDFLDAALALGRKDAAASTPPVLIEGPVPAPMVKRAGYARLQLLVQSESRPGLHAFLPRWLADVRELPQARRVRWSIDVDPIDLA